MNCHYFICLRGSKISDSTEIYTFYLYTFKELLQIHNPDDNDRGYYVMCIFGFNVM